MTQLAFYKGKGTWVDWTIRWATRSPYSHVELVDMQGRWWSSSERDGGVRWKRIHANSESWDFVDVAHATVDWNLFNKHMGAKYDYLGILLSHIFPIGRHDKQKWFCSEICGSALGFVKPQRLSPGVLYDLVVWSNGAKTKKE